MASRLPRRAVPRVSILMPVRDAEQYLAATLKSLLRQTLDDWELIAVDDGSSDRGPEMLHQAASRDPRVRVMAATGRGLVAALNQGLAACRSDLVARMDADDVCHPQRLELQINQMAKEPDLTLLAARIRHIPRSAIRDGMLAYEDWQNSLLGHAEIVRDFYVESPFAHPSVVFRRTAVAALGGYREMGWPEDYDLWLRLLFSGARFARRPEILLYWRDRPDRLSRTGTHCSQNAFRTCKAHFLQEAFLAGVNTVTLWGAGEEGKAWRQVLRTHRIEVERWIEVDPRKIGQIIHGAPVVGVEQLQPGQGKTLVTIGTRRARDQVRDFARAQALIEGKDYLCVT